MLLFSKSEDCTWARVSGGCVRLFGGTRDQAQVLLLGTEQACQRGHLVLLATRLCMHVWPTHRLAQSSQLGLV